MKQIIFLSLLLLIFVGCSSKKVDTYNKPAIFWYKKIIKEIASADLESADDALTSLQSEHINSEFLPEAMLLLAMLIQIKRNIN